MSVSGRSFSIITVLCVILLLAGCAGSAADKSAGEHVDDAVITTKVKTAMVQADEVDAVDVKVNTYKGIVQLTGFVDSENEASEAELIAGQVAGVKRVENRIQLKPDQ